MVNDTKIFEWTNLNLLGFLFNLVLLLNSECSAVSDSFDEFQDFPPT